MTRPARIGLPVPLVADAELSRWIQAISQRVNALPRDVASATDPRFSARGTGTGTGTGTGAGTGTGTGTGDQIPTLGIPVKPTGLKVAGGIGIVIVSWDNPFRFYSNHARTIIYRSTTENFTDATEVGSAQWMIFTDRGVRNNTRYWYWIRFESTESVPGPFSDSASGKTGTDPEVFYQELLAEILSDPLTDALRMDVRSPESITAEIRAIVTEAALLTTGFVDLNTRTIARVESSLGATLGPEPNIFTGAGRLDAEAARDKQSMDDAAWLEAYDLNPDNAIELRWGTT